MDKAPLMRGAALGAASGEQAPSPWGTAGGQSTQPQVALNSRRPSGMKWEGLLYPSPGGLIRQ